MRERDASRKNDYSICGSILGSPYLLETCQLSLIVLVQPAFLSRTHSPIVIGVKSLQWSRRSVSGRSHEDIGLGFKVGVWGCALAFTFGVMLAKNM